MVQQSKRKIDREVKKKIVNDFLIFISFLDEEYTIINLLSRFLTKSEWITLAKRLQIAILLVGRKSHEEISKELCVSTSTTIKINELLRSEIELNKAIKKIYFSKKPKINKRKLMDTSLFKTPSLGRNLIDFFLGEEW